MCITYFIPLPTAPQNQPLKSPPRLGLSTYDLLLPPRIKRLCSLSFYVHIVDEKSFPFYFVFAISF